MSILIILPTYNRSHLIGKVIKYISNQTYKNWNMIIINDGSNEDNTKKYREIISNTNNDKIIYKENEKNLNLPSSLNVGIKYFLDNDYEYMTWISDDNEYYKNFLQELVKGLSDKNDFVYTKFDYIRPRRNKKIYSTRKIYKDYTDILNRFHGFGAVGWTRDIIKKVGYFNEKLFLVEDFDYYLRTMVKTNKHKYLDISTMKIILTGINLTSTHKPKIKILKEVVDKIYNQILFNKYDKIKFIDENKFDIKDNIFYCNKKYEDITKSIIDNINGAV